MSKQSHSDFLQVQQVLDLLLKLVGRPGTGSYPSSIVPPENPHIAWDGLNFFLERVLDTSWGLYFPTPLGDLELMIKVTTKNLS